MIQTFKNTENPTDFVYRTSILGKVFSIVNLKVNKI